MNSDQSQAASRWKRVYTLPNNPPVVLFYDGLLGLCFNKNEEAEIGYLCTAASHQPRLKVIGVKNGKATMLLDKYWPCHEPPVKEIKLEVTEPCGEFGFFMPHDTKDDRRDFRWLIDIEELHNGRPLDKQDDCFLPCLTLKHGVFYTLLLTKERYTAYPEGVGEPTCLGEIAYWTAAGLDCDPVRGGIALTFDDQTSFESPVNGQRLFVIVQNHCEPHNSHWCQGGDPRDTDFDLYYEALKPASYRVKHKVIADSKPSRPDLSSITDVDLLKALKLANYVRRKRGDGKDFIVSTNEAPCGRTGFGYSDELGD
jgi:hypothetical protein